MKLDSNQAWKEAVAAVSANREVLLALAGVFFLLPSLAFALLMPPPEPQGAMQPEAMMKLFQDFYISALPYVIPMAFIQTVGSLAVLTLFTDRSRPTVGQAISQGFGGVLPYLAAQVLLGLALGLVGGVLIGLAAVAHSVALAVVAVLILIGALVYGALRLSLIAPVIAVDRIRNPLAALRRSWELTQGNAGRIALFLFLVFIVFAVVMIIAMGIIGVVLALVLGGSAAKTVATVISSGFGAAFSLYFLAIVASIHRQLSGPSGDSISATFD